MSALPLVLIAEWCAVAVALPAIRLELGASATGVLMLLLALLVPAAVLLLPAERLPRRPALLAGIVLFGAGGLACALAGSIAVLVAAAGVQGVGAAALLAHSAGLGSPALRAAGCGLALTAGPVAGAYLVEAADWRWVFWLALPVAALAALPALLRPRPADRSLDPQPAGSGVAACALAGAFATMALLVPQYGQFVLERSAPGSALLLLPAGAALLVLSLPAAWLAGRVSGRPLSIAGLACATAGMLAVTFVDADTGPRALVPGLVLLGAGLALAFAPAQDGNRAAVPAGGALLLALGGGLANWVQTDQREAGASFDAALSDGLAAAGWMLAAALVLAAVLTALPRPQAKLVSNTPS